MSLQIEVFKPRTDPVKHLIECYWHVTSTDFIGPLINIPDGRQEIVIDLLNKSITRDFGRPFPVFKHVQNNVDLLIIRFHPYGLTCLTKQLLNELSSKKIEQFSRHPDQLYLSVLDNMFGNFSVVRKLESFEEKIIKTVNIPASIEPVVLDLISRINSDKGRQKLNSLYKFYTLSDRQLQIHFKNSTGMTPKNFSKIVRLSNVRMAKSLHDQLSLTEISYEYGYADQSHLIKDFKQLSGLTPLRYLRRKSAIEFIYHPD